MKTLVFSCIFICSTMAIAINKNNTLPDLLQKAKSGDSIAELEYAKAISATSNKEAFFWAKKAAQQGLAEAWFWLGNNSSTSDSIYYYTQAAKLGYTQALPILVDHYMMDSKDFIKAKEFADMAKQKNILVGLSTEDSQEKNQTIHYCIQAGLPKIPSADFPKVKEKILYTEGEDCVAYHFGLDRKKDDIQYRQCLLSQRELNNLDLAEIYANGWGVPKNLKLALALVCHANNLAPAELSGMTKILYENLTSNSSKNFDYCKHITSGFNMGLCAHKYEKLAIAKRQDNLQNITSTWPAAHLNAFNHLKKIADEFYELHSTLELDMSGTAGTAIATGEKSSLQDQFISSINMFEAGKLPKNSNFIVADQELNEVYDQLMKTQLNSEITTLSTAGFKKTQKKWLEYRDAWAAFGILHYPNTTTETWKTWATVKRIQQLKEIYKNMA